MDAATKKRLMSKAQGKPLHRGKVGLSQLGGVALALVGNAYLHRDALAGWTADKLEQGADVVADLINDREETRWLTEGADEVGDRLGGQDENPDARAPGDSSKPNDPLDQFPDRPMTEAENDQ